MNSQLLLIVGDTIAVLSVDRTLFEMAIDRLWTTRLWTTESEVRCVTSDSNLLSPGRPLYKAVAYQAIIEVRSKLDWRRSDWRLTVVSNQTRFHAHERNGQTPPPLTQRSGDVDHRSTSRYGD